MARLAWFVPLQESWGEHSSEQVARRLGDHHHCHSSLQLQDQGLGWSRRKAARSARLGQLNRLLGVMSPQPCNGRNRASLAIHLSNLPSTTAMLESVPALFSSFLLLELTEL